VKILPPKAKAVDDDSIEAERPDRVLMDILYGLPKEFLMTVSPESQMLKTWMKLPLLVFVNLAAMSASMSEMFLKMVGCVLKDAET